MDRNSITGLVLITAILLGYSYFFGPSPEELEKQKQATEQRDSTETLNPVKEPEVLKQAVDKTDLDSTELLLNELLAKKTYGDFYKNTQGEPKTIIVNNGVATYTFSTKGARLSQVELTEYTRYNGQKLKMFDASSARFAALLTLGSLQVNSEDLIFNYDGDHAINLTGDESITLNFSAGEGTQKLNYQYTLKANDYYVDFDLSHNAESLDLEWYNEGFSNEKHLDTERTKSSVYFRLFEEKRDYLSEQSDDEEILESELHWVAFKQDFFSSALISRQGQLKTGSKLSIVPFTDTLHTKKYAAQLALQGKQSSFMLYYGPNEQKILTQKDVAEFDRIIDFGWGIFGWVNKYLILNLFLLLDGSGLSYGIIILVLTLLIKLALSPLTYKNFLSSAKMRVLKPEIEALNEKNKNADPLKKQQATMALYRETGVNPMAGCLPMILQMPILYAMFRFFPASIQLRQEGFLWADDLSSFDSVLELPFSIPFYGDHVSLFTLMLALSTFFYTKLNMGNTAMPSQQSGMPQINMKVMMYIFPFMMLFFFNNYSSGLSYYYFLSNVISIAQMYVIRNYIVDDAKILAKIEANKKQKPKKSKFQERMEEMAKKRGVTLPKNAK